MRKSNLFSALALMLVVSILNVAQAQKKEYYEIRVFHLKNKAQENLVDNYLQKAFLPTLHQNGFQNIGVFKPIEKDTALFGKRIYVMIPYKKLEQITKTPGILANISSDDATVNTYLDAQQSNPAFVRTETILLTSFVGNPKMQVPSMSSPKTGRVYELRSYESASEKLYHNKVQMFNVGDEIGLFKRLKFNAVFYAEVLAGARMPNLMYMTCFDNLDHRNAQWDVFRKDAQWLTLKDMPEYKKPNVSKSDIILLHPTDYSDY